MSLRTKGYDSLLDSTRKMIANALGDEEIKTLLLPYKYDETRLKEGMTLYDQTYEAFEKQKRDYTDQVKAKAEYDRLLKKFNDMYMEHVRLCRLALDQCPELQRLSTLDTGRARTGVGWIMQAKQFYNNISENQEILALVDTFGLTPGKLAEGKNKITQLENAKDVHDKACGTAQQSTVDRDNIKKKMQRWTYKLIKVSRIALKEKPQLLEKLGITKLSDGYVKQSTVRKAKEKAQEKEKEKEKDNDTETTPGNSAAKE